MSAHTAEDILLLLEQRWPTPAWATFRELQHNRRRIDLWAQGVWPSKGHLGVAVEVKVSRSDFRRELDDPTKRAPWENLASECWFAAPAGVIPLQEIPEGWGLIEVIKGGKLRAKRRALQRRVSAYPVSFVASLARRSQDEQHEAAYYELQRRKVTWPDLLKLADRAGAIVHGREAARLRRRLDLVQENKERTKGAFDLLRMVQLRCGFTVNTAEAFDQWLRENHGTPLSSYDRRRLSGALEVLQQMVGES